MKQTEPGWWWARLATGATAMVYRVVCYGYDDGPHIELYGGRQPLAEMEKIEGFELLAPIPSLEVCAAMAKYSRVCDLEGNDYNALDDLGDELRAEQRGARKSAL